MEVFQHGQRDEITRLETEISTLTHAMGDDPDDLHAQVLQLRTERNDFERHAISAREDLHNAETDRDRLRLEAVQAGDEIRDLQAQISNLERETDDARSESATALASYNRISSSLTRSPSDRGLEPSNNSLESPKIKTMPSAIAIQLSVYVILLLRHEIRLAWTFSLRPPAQLNSTTISRWFDWSSRREREMSDLQVAHDQLTVLRDLAESDLNEADLFLTHLASRIRESQATRMPKRERSPPTSPPQLPPSKTPRSDRPVSPPHNQDQSEVEDLDGQERQNQHEFEGGDDQEHRDPSEIEGEGDQEHEDQHEFEGPDDQDHRDHVPLYSDVKIFTAAEINPWDPLVVGPVPILVMI
ncbi:hypothetical protein PHMEG_00028368 [Phytophthora megakarya]|uniref:Uncharacterized protein n=1 Tax=Phytophthora megakarya TaxID=4795 RepID=A0A225V7M7_9STRA|nr:hypothetical protein PHMEG_00028368 [Phytophthora megakarya]